MATRKTVTATADFVAIIGGGYRKVAAGDELAATDPVVKANAALFTATSAAKK
jgi:hypothetical protein